MKSDMLSAVEVRHSGQPVRMDFAYMTRAFSIEYDDGILASVGQSEAEFAQTARFVLAGHLHSTGRLSAGHAARFCGMGKVEFLNELPRHGFHASNLTADDAPAELAFARAR